MRLWAIVLFAGRLAVAGAVDSVPITSNLGSSCRNTQHCACYNGSGCQERSQSFVHRLLRGRKNPPARAKALPEDFPGANTTTLFAAFTLCIFAFLSAASAGVLRIRVKPSETWLVVAAPQLYFHLAQAGLGPWIGAAPALGSSPEHETWNQTLFGVFTALVAQGASFILICKAGPKSALVHVLYPPVAIYALAWCYYYYKAHAAPLVMRADVFGGALYPLHMVLWMCSTSVQAVLWKQVHHALCVGGPHTPFELPARAILCAFTMLWAGILCSVDYGASGGRPLPLTAAHASGAGGGPTPTAANYAALGVCCVAFYGLLLDGTAPLQQCIAFYDRLSSQRLAARQANLPQGGVRGGLNGSNPRATPESAAMQRTNFRAMLAYIFMSWHSFPFIFALAMFGYIGPEHCEFLYTLGDLSAKFLPVTVYLSLLSFQ